MQHTASTGNDLARSADAVYTQRRADIFMFDIFKGKTRQLFETAKQGDVAAVRRLVEAGADVNWHNPDWFSWTPLHTAADKGHTEAVQALLQAGADVSARSQIGRTPLHMAAENSHLEAVVALLQAGADVGAKDKDGGTPLNYAVRGGRVEVVKAVLQAGADQGAKNKYGWTPLHSAAWHGKLEAVRVLLEVGADVGAETKDGGTPLHEAARGGHVEVVKALLKAGADQGAKNKAGRTPLHSAAENGNLEVVVALLQAGADVGAKDQDGGTPLHDAAQKGHVEVVKALLQAGADQGVKNKGGKTPLDVAATWWGTNEQVKEALRAAANRPPQTQVAAPSPSTTTPVVACLPPAVQPSGTLALYTGGPVTLPSPLAGGQVQAVAAALRGASLPAAVVVVGAMATCNPVALVMGPMVLLKMVQTLLQQGHYSHQRVQRMAARIAAMEPALTQLAQELQPPMRTSTPETVVQSLCAALCLLVHVLAQLQELQRRLLNKGEGMLRRTLQALKAGAYEQDMAVLDLELRDCLTQLSAILSIAQFTQAAQVVRAREELQVAQWKKQNEADRMLDLQQLEGLMVEAAGGIKELQRQLEEQRVVLDGQVVGLQQVAEWLQQMQAGSSVISQHLQELHGKVDDIKDGMEGMHVDLGAKMDSMQDKLHELVRYMCSKQGATRKGIVPNMVIERSRIVLAADALAQGTSGAFGTVVKAVHDGVEVAVKVYNHRVLGEIDSEAAMGEALLLSKANHHNVVRCFGIVHDPEAPEGTSLHGSLVMEWVGSGNLYQWLQGNRGLGLPARAQLALQVAAGMRHLHERRLVHGDLKPQNVLLMPVAAGTSTVPQAKICDFGLAKHTSTSAQLSYQRNTSFTAAYTSPERLTNFCRSSQDDVYAFGILLFFVATGCTPFADIPPQQLVLAIERGVRPEIGDWVAQQQQHSGATSAEGKAAADLSQLAQRCWDAQPGQRPRWQEVYQQLEGIHQALAAA